MKTEEVKPCPACGGPPEYAGDAEGTEFWIACGCLRSCRMGGPTRKTMAEAVAAWNALPRRLRWTKEKPTQDAEWYWYRDIEEGPAIGYLLDGCLSFLGGRYVYIDNAPGEFAGPIHEPEEE